MASKTREFTIFQRRFRVWFDRSYTARGWWAMELDADGNQIGEAIHHIDRDILLTLVGAIASQSREG